MSRQACDALADHLASIGGGVAAQYYRDGSRWCPAGEHHVPQSGWSAGAWASKRKNRHCRACRKAEDARRRALGANQHPAVDQLLDRRDALRAELELLTVKAIASRAGVPVPLVRRASARRRVPRGTSR